MCRRLKAEPRVQAAALLMQTGATICAKLMGLSASGGKSALQSDARPTISAVTRMNGAMSFT